jgi:hypothetical protein
MVKPVGQAHLQVSLLERRFSLFIHSQVAGDVLEQPGLLLFGSIS